MKLKTDARTTQSDSRVLPSTTRAPAIARNFVVSTVRAWNLGAAFDDVPLLASELVTNAVRHTYGDVALSVARDGNCVRVAVRDTSDADPVLRDIDTARDGGWGLHIVERLSSRWGLERHANGKTVWCEVRDGPAADRAGTVPPIR